LLGSAKTQKFANWNSCYFHFAQPTYNQVARTFETNNELIFK